MSNDERRAVEAGLCVHCAEAFAPGDDDHDLCDACALAALCIECGDHVPGCSEMCTPFDCAVCCRQVHACAVNAEDPEFDVCAPCWASLVERQPAADA